ncbi:murein biosynthesis integral membrane protein MurJ [Candidatus Poribacteria bacterium]
MTQDSAKEEANTGLTHSRLTRSAGIVSIAVMCSRVLGLVREQVLAALFEAQTGLDAFKAAFTIPNLMRDLFGEGILSKALVATFKDVEAKSGEKAVWRLANLVFNTTAIILVIITIVGIALSPLVVGLIFRGKGFDTALPSESSFGFADKRELTIYLTRVMFPFLLLVSLAATAMGLLNSKGRFGVPASASSFFNLGSVIVGVLGYRMAPNLGYHPLAGMAVGVLVGGALQFLIQIPSMWRVGFRYKPILSFTDPGLKQVMKLVTPALLGYAALQVNLLLNRFFASQGEGWITWNVQAFRIVHLPIGVIGVAISTASLPALSQFVAQDSMEEYKRTFTYALKLMFVLALPAAAGLIALNKPIVSLIFERLKFGSDDTIQVAGALFCYAFGLCGYSGRQIAVDGFIALKDMRTPVIVSLFTIALNILLNYILIFGVGFKHRSLAVSTACSITVNFVLVLSLLWRRVNGFGGYDLGSVFVRSVIAAAGMGIIALLTHNQLSGFVGSKLSLMATIIVAMPVLYVLYRLLKVREFDQVIKAIVEKIKR